MLMYSKNFYDPSFAIEEEIIFHQKQHIRNMRFGRNALIILHGTKKLKRLA